MSILPPSDGSPKPIADDSHRIEKFNNKLKSLGNVTIFDKAIETLVVYKNLITGEEIQTLPQRRQTAAVKLLTKYENHIKEEHLPEIILLANRLGTSLNKPANNNNDLNAKIEQILKRFEKDISEYTKSHEVIRNATVMKSDYDIIRNGIAAFSSFVNFKIGDSRPILSFLSNFSDHFKAYLQELEAIKQLSAAEKQEIHDNTKKYGGETEADYLNACEQFKNWRNGNPPPAERKTEIVWHPKTDSLDAARAFLEMHPLARIAIANFANPVRVGGADSTGGKGSQEENIIRQTLLRVSLEYAAEIADSAVLEATGRYLGYYSAIVSKDIGTIGKDEKFGYITTSAADLRTGIRSEGSYLKKQLESDKLVEEINYRKLKVLLMSAAMEGYDVVDLGAFGCGAFGNDAKVIANTIKNILSEAEFQGVFSHIIFPISQNDKNFTPFKAVLNAI